jgi:sphingolipid delta-4 desaturase
MEASLIRNRTCMKMAYMFLQLLFYALRPTFIKPLKPNRYLAANIVIQASYNAALVYLTGSWNTLLYLGVSSFFAGSFHPTAGHFLSEHLEVVAGIETYSYYGPLNYVCYNVGYHNEHHDFPFVAWSNLPKVRSFLPRRALI